MTWRLLTAALAAACVVGPADGRAAEKKSGKEAPAPAAAASSIKYLPLDAPAGMSQAGGVQGLALVHTRQLFPLDREGKLVGEGSADKQIEQVLANLETVLKDSGSGLDKLVRLNVYALSPAIVDSLREHLGKRLGASVRPVITSVLTPLAVGKALVAVDAVAGAADGPKTVALKRCASVAGAQQSADAAVLPRGGVAYLSGQPDEGGLTVSAVVRSMSNLMKTLGHMKLSPEHVVHLKIFLRPVTSAEEVRREVQKFFPGQLAPPMVFVEWLAAVPIEIEMIAQFPASGKPGPDLEYFTPPEVRPSNTFSKAAIVRTDRQIYLSGLYARQPSRGEPQAKDVFGQLQSILTATGSDMRHLVKAMYYVSDDDAARWVDRTRPLIFDPTRPPAASKVMVHGVGMPQRTMTVDMIAVGGAK